MPKTDFKTSFICNINMNRATLLVSVTDMTDSSMKPCRQQEDKSWGLPKTTATSMANQISTNLLQEIMEELLLL